MKPQEVQNNMYIRQNVVEHLPITTKNSPTELTTWNDVDTPENEEELYNINVCVCLSECIYECNAI